MSLGRILLVEDDRFLRTACTASLAQRGFAVDSAGDGEEGLRLARTHTYDLILLDLLMPRKPGIEVLTELKADASTRGVPVLILSNSSRRDDRERALELGAVGYYIKANLSLRKLAEEIEILLRGPSAPKTDA